MCPELDPIPHCPEPWIVDAVSQDVRQRYGSLYTLILPMESTALMYAAAAVST
jgi:hypothetical protein